MAARAYGRKLRRAVAGTAVAAAAMAALSASQAPVFFPVAHADAKPRQSPVATAPPGPAIDGGSPYITDMPPLNTPTGPPLVTPTSPGATTPGSSVPGGAAGLPATVLDAYRRAEASVARTDPGCHLPWQLLAAIGQVESGQARHGSVDADGTTYRPILGPVLDGNGFASISDTDGGRYDGDARYDRAVGPMQFIPSTWAHWGVDGNGDGNADPNNVYDAALAAAHYLCADGRDLSVPADMDRAILGYNHSDAYLRLVKAWYAHFMRGAVAVPDRPGSPSAPGAPAAPGTAGATGAPVSPTGTASSPPTPPGKSPTPTTSPTASAEPSDGPSGGSTSAPPSGGTTTAPPTAPGTTPPTTDPTDPTTPPTTTAPGCQSPTPSDTPTATPTDTATPSPSSTPTDDPCATDSPSPEPSATASATPSVAASAEATPAS